MSPKAVDLKIVNQRLSYFLVLLGDLQRLPAGSFEEFSADWKNAPTAESLVRRAVEALLDTARHLLSRAYGLGTLQYRQVAHHAAEKGLIADPELGRILLQIAGFRNRLAHHYEDVTAHEIYSILADHLHELEAIGAELRAASERLTAK